MRSRLTCATNVVTVDGGPAGMGNVVEVKVVVAHDERVQTCVDDVFLKIDSDQTLTDIEVETMALAPIPTPEVLWRKPPVLALAALPGTPLSRLGEPSTASSAAWAAAGTAARILHDAALPPWPGRSVEEMGGLGLVTGSDRSQRSGTWSERVVLSGGCSRRDVSGAVRRASRLRQPPSKAARQAATTLNPPRRQPCVCPVVAHARAGLHFAQHAGGTT